MGKSRLFSAFLLLCLGLLFGCAYPPQDSGDMGQPVAWADKAMELAVRQHLGKPTETIFSGELDSIRIIAIHASSIQFNNNHIFYSGDSSVAQLGDLAHFRKLGGLRISRTWLSDLSVLADCRELQQLYLFENPNLLDITPITGLPRLSQLLLYSNGEVDLEPLRTLPQLQELDLRRNKLQSMEMEGAYSKLRKLKLEANQITDLSFLSTVTTLRELDLRNNYIADLTPLQSLIKLQKLNLRGNSITDLSPLLESSYPDLAMLDISFNQVSDLTPLSHLGRLSTVNLAFNQVEDLTPLAQLAELRVLNASGNCFASTEPLGKLSNMLELNLSQNLLDDISAVKKLRRLTILDLTGCGVIQADLHSLAKELPSCSILT